MKKFRTVMQYARQSGGVLVWENRGFALYKPSTPLSVLMCEGKKLLNILKKMDKILKFLKDHPLISINGLEKKCKMPRDCIYKVKTGQRKMPTKHLSKLVEVLKEYGYK